MGTLCHHSRAKHLRGTSSPVGGTRCWHDAPVHPTGPSRDTPSHSNHRPIDRFHRTDTIHSKKPQDFTDLPNPFVPPLGVRCATHCWGRHALAYAGVITKSRQIGGVEPSCFGIAIIRGSGHRSAAAAAAHDRRNAAQGAHGARSSSRARGRRTEAPGGRRNHHDRTRHARRTARRSEAGDDHTAHHSDGYRNYGAEASERGVKR